MELTATLWARWAACLVVVAALHRIARRWESLSAPEKVPDVPLAASLLTLAAAFFWIPVGSFASADATGSLLGVWTLLQMALVLRILQSKEGPQSWESAEWLCVWGMALAGPVTVFSQLDLERVALIQDGTLFGLPRWGVFFQPPAFAIALLAIVQWNRLQYGATLFLLGFPGAVNALLLCVTVSVFLGAWHVPWLADARLAELLRERVWLISLFQVGVFFAKLSLLWALVLWALRKMPSLGKRSFALSRGMLAAAVNLTATWALLAGRAAW